MGNKRNTSLRGREIVLYDGKQLEIEIQVWSQRMTNKKMYELEKEMNEK